MAAARRLRVWSCVHRALWTLQVRGRACACTACTYTPQHAALGKMLRSRARPVLHALISSTSGSHCSKFKRAHRFSHPPHSQVCRLAHGKKGCTGTKAWLAEFLTPAFTNAVCKLHDVLRLARTSGHHPCDDQVRPLARAARNESVPVHSIECPPGTARPSVHSHCAPRAHISDLI